MSTVPEAVKALLLDQRAHHCWDLWTFELTCGVTLRWTSADIDLTVDGHLYRSEIAITRGKCKLACGIENSTQEVTLSPGALDQEPSIAGVPMRQAIRAGLFDGARTRLQWAYYEITRPPQLVGTITRFTGTVGEIDGYKSKAVLTINSPLKRLDMQIPWKSYGAGCRYILGDADCGVDVSAFAVTGTVMAGSTNGTVVTDIAGEDNAWAGGTVTVGGVDGAWWRRTIRASQGGVLHLKTPLPWAPGIGEAINAYPGCDRSYPEIKEETYIGPVPNAMTVRISADDVFLDDKGVNLIGATRTTGGEFIGWDNDGQPSYAPIVKIKDPDVKMVRVQNAPASGEYAILGGQYLFSIEDLGKDIAIRCAKVTGADRGCRRFGNIKNYGGMPLIPSPETAY